MLSKALVQGHNAFVPKGSCFLRRLGREVCCHILPLLLVLSGSFMTPCWSQQDCVEFNTRVLCLSDGGFEYQLEITNVSTFTFEYLFLLPAGASALSPEVFELINIAPGDSATFVYSVVGATEGEELCFEQVLHSSDLSQCCFLDICIVLSCDTEIEFIRGDCNGDGSFDIADVIALLAELFSSGDPSGCADACDCNDDGLLNIADAISKLTTLFGGGGSLPGPTMCGPDPTADDLDCQMSPC